ncbi:VanZ family protein [Micrococcus terreus]|uniref:VanZ like family protein n=1 Tax=Micrococcus terreus TaxID=574650 RepID=A0A1I7MF28_9MICC|nr:VanZ family protein [Micrococcus terreus]SFV20430.1 VanZ like family protein [Micrococcus terreus]
MRSAFSTFQGVIPATLLAGVVLAILIWAIRQRIPAGRRWTPTRTVLLWVVLSWLSGVLALTVLLPAGGSGAPMLGPDSMRVDLVPFRDLVENGGGLGGVALLERSANLVMFTVGGLLAALALNWGVVRTGIVLLVGGVAIETIQYLATTRSVTADDVLWALFGGLLGAAIAWPIRRSSWYRTRVLTSDHHAAVAQPA